MLGASQTKCCRSCQSALPRCAQWDRGRDPPQPSNACLGRWLCIPTHHRQLNVRNQACRHDCKRNALPPQVQQQLIGFLPEVALPEEHERVVEVLMG